MNTAIEKEIAQLVEKRDAMREKQMDMWHKSEATRARNTTFNARIGDITDRIFELKQILKATAA